jgi:hypothetical protein
VVSIEDTIARRSRSLVAGQHPRSRTFLLEEAKKNSMAVEAPVGAAAATVSTA